MIAISLVHGGPAPRFLSPVLFEALVWGPEKTKVPVDLVPDEEVREALIKVCNIGYSRSSVNRNYSVLTGIR